MRGTRNARIRASDRRGQSRVQQTDRRRERLGRTVLHERHDRQAQRRRDYASLALPARALRCGWHAHDRRGRDSTHRPVVPRQRMGDPSVSDTRRGNARHAPQVRPGRVPQRRAKPQSNAHVRRADHVQYDVEPPRSGEIRSLCSREYHARRRARPPPARESGKRKNREPRQGGGTGVRAPPQ